MGWPEANAVIAPAPDEENEETVDGETGGVEMDAYGFPMTNSRAPATRGSAIQQLRQGVQDSLVTQNKGITSLQDLVNQYGAAKEPGEGMDLSPLLAYADSVNGTDIAKSYKKPMTAQEKIANMVKLQSTVNNERQPLTADLQRGLSTDESAESKYYKALTHKTEQGDKAEVNLHDMLFFSKRGIPQEVKADIGKLARARAYSNLAEALPGGKATPQELASLTGNLTSLVSNSNIMSDERFRHTFPAGLELTVANVVQWLTSGPHAADNRAWLKRQANEVAAEARGAMKNLKGWQDNQYQSLSGGVDPEKAEKHYKAAKAWLKEYGDQIPNINGEPIKTKADYPKGTKFQYSPDGTKTRILIPGSQPETVNGIIR